MKKTSIILMAIAFLSFSSANIYAQDYKHTVTAGAGFSLIGTLFKAITYSPDATSTGTSFDDSGYSTIPAIQLSYGFMVSDRISVGAAGSHQYFNFDNDATNEYVHIKRSNFAIRGLIHYGSSSKIDMYSGVRLGATIWKSEVKFDDQGDPTAKQFNDLISEKLSGTKFAPQLIAFGLRGYFTDNIGAFAELAIGPPAYLSAGVNFRF